MRCLMSNAPNNALNHKLIRLEASILERAMGADNRPSMCAITEVVRHLSIADAQYLCGAYGCNELTVPDAVLGLSAKIMLRHEKRTAAFGEMKSDVHA